MPAVRDFPGWQRTREPGLANSTGYNCGNEEERVSQASNVGTGSDIDQPGDFVCFARG